MKKTAYIRVSTQAQSYDRQVYDLNKYFIDHGIDPSTISFVAEKITSYTTFKERAIYPTLKAAQTGDIVYVCQLDRLGRTVEDIIHLVKFADSKGVELYAIKEGQRITYTTQTGRMMLTLLAMVAEMERELRAERCQSGMEAAQEELKKNGYRISRSSGKIQTRWGNAKGCDMSAAFNASTQARIARKNEWREKSIAFNWVIDKLRDGWTRGQIIDEFNKLHEFQPEVFSTPKGAKLSKGVLSYWIKDAGVNIPR